MQKKVKSKLTDTLFVIFCLSCATYSFYDFWKSLNKSLIKNEKPIATITFKYKTAQRKFSDDLIWDRLNQNSPVYEGDTIRTAALSEATIHFRDGNIMELQENTMARISVKSDGLEVDLTGGHVSLQTNTEANNVKLKTGNSVVNVEAGSAISVNDVLGEKISVQVQNGTAQFISENGEVTLEEGKTTQFTETGTITKNTLSVTLPTANQKFLSFKNGTYDVPFKWSTDADEVKIQVSTTKDFINITYEKTVTDENKINIPLAAGTHYWKITAGEEILTGKITILYSPIPQLISPKSDTPTVYRTKLPRVHFAWTESANATSYELKVSRNKDMSSPLIVQRSSTTSSNINSLEAGTYYWTVTPFYMVNNLGLGESSEIKSFRIIQNEKLQPPKLIVPVNQGLVSTKIPLSETESTYKVIKFSWYADSEASSYTFKLWEKNASGTPIISEQTKNNYFSIDTSITQINNGNCFWQVDIADSEGNITSSEIRQFYAIDTNAEQRTLFPPDTYRVAQTRSQDMIYSWKTNIPFDSVLEVARDKTFTQIVYTEKTSSTSLNSRNLAEGNYYWRISTDVGSMILSTPSKQLIVEAPLQVPECTTPINYTKAVIREDVPLEFKWKHVEGIDYYQVKLYKSNDSGTVVKEQNFIEPKTAISGYKNGNNEVSCSFDLWDLPETSYYWTVQGFREETTLQSRATSYIASNNFTMKKLRPVELVTPAMNQVIDGIEAVKNPTEMKWYSVDQTKDVKLVIYSDTVSEKDSIWKFDQKSTQTKMPILYEGNYFWKIYAQTLDNYDISSKVIGKFSITSIPKLKATNIIEPKPNKVYDTAYFINPNNAKSLSFSWSKVEQAEQYIFTIKNKTTKKVIVQETFDSATTKYEITDLKLLDRGDFTWSVEPQSVYEGRVFQHGEIAEQEFTIDLPVLKKTQANETGKKRYGTSSK